MKSFCQVWKYINCFAWMQAIFTKQHFVCDSVNVSNDHTKLNMKSDKTFLENTPIVLFLHQCDLEKVKGIQNWYERTKLSQSYYHLSLKDLSIYNYDHENSSMFKFVKQMVRHWSLHRLQLIMQVTKKERKEKKIKKSIKRNHEKPIKMPLGC